MPNKECESKESQDEQALSERCPEGEVRLEQESSQTEPDSGAAPLCEGCVSVDAVSLDAVLEDQRKDEDLKAAEQSHDQEALQPKEGEAKPSKEAVESTLDLLKNLLQGDLSVDRKLKMALDFMEEALADKDSVRFKDFWEARKLCLDLFKQEVSPAIRPQLWSRYGELSRQARRLKEVIDEQSAFAAEQIEIAVKALEESLEKISSEVQKVSAESLEGLSKGPRRHEIAECQQELNLLNLYASRLNVLRQELAKTSMRIRVKNDLFKRLSAAGDKIFPRRKVLIAKNSQAFLEEVKSFVEKNFAEGNFSGELFSVREQVKALQKLASSLTLSAQGFKKSREDLGKAWDILKEADRDRRRDRAKKRSEQKENVEKLLKEIASFEEKAKAEGLADGKVIEGCQKIVDSMRTIDLSRDDQQKVREAIAALKAPIEQKEKLKKEQHQKQADEKEQLRKQRIEELKASAESLLAAAGEMPLEQLHASRKELAANVQQQHLSKQDRLTFDHLFRALKKRVAEKQDQEVLEQVSSEDEKNSKELKGDIKKLKIHRKQLKEQLDSLKQEKSASGLDIGRAIELSQEIEEMWGRLEAVDSALEKLEDKKKT